MKKTIIILITILLIYIIYNHFSFNKINYVSITDNMLSNYNKYISNNKLGSFNNYFTSSSIFNLYQDIQNNKTIKVDNEIYYLKKVLRESDVLVISVGMEELNKSFSKYDMNNNNNYFSKMLNNIESLIKEIKKYAFGKIIFIGYYNPTNYYDANIDCFFYNVNVKLERVMIDNDVIYLDLYEKVKGNKQENSFDKIIANTIDYYLS